MNIKDLFPSIVILGVAGFGGAIMLSALTNLRTTVGAMTSGGLDWDNSAPANFTDSVNSSLLAMDDWFPVFITVIAGAIAIGVIVMFSRNART